MSVGSTNVTPRFPPWPSLWMGGYGWGRRGNKGAVARELIAHCAVIFDDGTPNVLVRVDTTSIPRDVHQAIREQVVAEGLVASSDFIMVASHTHSGPMLGDTTPDPFILMGLGPADIQAVNWSTDIFRERIVDLVRDTVNQGAVPVTLGFATGSAEIAFNRAELDTVLTDVPVLLARSEESGDPVAVLFGYACHPVSRGNDIVFDSDYCGRAAEVVAGRLGVPALYFQGAAGDQDPVGARGPDRVVQLGDELAGAVLDVIDNDEFQEVTGPITSRLVEVQLPYAVDVADPAVLAELTEKYEQRVQTTPADNVLNRHAVVMLRQITNGELAPTIPMPIQRWKLGGLTILALAHEVVSGYDVAIRKLGFDGSLWIMGYAGEVGCYVPTDDSLWAGGHKHGGYEAGWIDDPRITGDGTSQMAFARPAPLKPSPVGRAAGQPGSVQGIVLDACRDLLGVPPPVSDQ